MSQYLNIQLKGCHPVEFLHLSKGHDMQRDIVITQTIPETDIEIDIVVNEKLSIKRDDKK